MIVYFDGETCHATTLDRKPGEALCGFPPRRSNGDRWSLSDEIPDTAGVYFSDEEMIPLVDCEYCHKAYEELYEHFGGVA